MPPYCVVLKVLADFASYFIKMFIEPKVGCPTIFVKVASPKVSFTIEVIDAVVRLSIFSLFRRLASIRFFWIGYRIFRSEMASDGRERTDNSAAMTVFNSRLVFRASMASNRQEWTDNPAAMTVFDSRLVFGISCFNWVSGGSAAALQGYRLS